MEISLHYHNWSGYFFGWIINKSNRLFIHNFCFCVRILAPAGYSAGVIYSFSSAAPWSTCPPLYRTASPSMLFSTAGARLFCGLQRTATLSNLQRTTSCKCISGCEKHSINWFWWAHLIWLYLLPPSGGKLLPSYFDLFEVFCSGLKLIV